LELDSESLELDLESLELDSESLELDLESLELDLDLELDSESLLELLLEDFRCFLAGGCEDSLLSVLTGVFLSVSSSRCLFFV